MVIALPATMPAKADEETEREAKKAIMDELAYTREKLKGAADAVFSEGSMEFWSSGGLLQKVPAGIEPPEYDAFRIDVKYIAEITLVPSQIAVAHFYSEGLIFPKNLAQLNDYRTRATEVLVKDDADWRVRAARWSPIQGDLGTSTASLVK